MRTTITLDDETAAAVLRLRRDRGMGVSAAVNELVKRGLAHPTARPRFVQTTSDGGVRLDVSDVAEVLDLLGEPTE